MYHLQEPYELNPEQVTMEETTLYDLMANDYDVYLTKNEDGYELEISGEDLHLHEKGINKCAIDSFADICRSFLWFYDKIQEKEKDL